jgi:uncharacterized membrane protein YeaQ/YmgE (transglycosylase-associated protein family)
MMRIFWWIIVGLVAGWLTGKIMKGEEHGTLMDIVIGMPVLSSGVFACISSASIRKVA